MNGLASGEGWGDDTLCIHAVLVIMESGKGEIDGWIDCWVSVSYIGKAVYCVRSTVCVVPVYLLYCYCVVCLVHIVASKDWYAQ